MIGNGLKPIHVLVVVLLVVLLFGAKRLPELAKSVGQSLKIFKAEIKDLTDDSNPKPTDTTPVVPAAGPSVPLTPPVPPAAPPADSTPPPSPQVGTSDDTGSPRV